MGFWWVVLVTGYSSGRQCGDLCVELLEMLQMGDGIEMGGGAYLGRLVMRDF